LLEVYRTDPLVIEYDKAIKKADFTQIDDSLLSGHMHKLDYDSLSIVRYHFKHTRIGWNVNKLISKVRAKKS
jgi:hypothetical protein